MGEAVIDLPVHGRSQRVRSVTEMRTRDVTAAFWLVEAHAEYLLERWSEYHG
jgi:hypothetical protein